MPNLSNVVPLLPKTAAQAKRFASMARRGEFVSVAITVMKDGDRFQEQRVWRFLFGLYQDCACIRWSKGFTKTPGSAFVGKMRPSRLPLFLREAMPLVVQGRAELRVNGERVRRRLLDVLAA